MSMGFGFVGMWCAMAALPMLPLGLDPTVFDLCLSHLLPALYVHLCSRHAPPNTLFPKAATAMNDDAKPLLP